MANRGRLRSFFDNITKSVPEQIARGMIRAVCARPYRGRANSPVHYLNANRSSYLPYEYDSAFSKIWYKIRGAQLDPIDTPMPEEMRTECINQLSVRTNELAELIEGTGKQFVNANTSSLLKNAVKHERNASNCVNHDGYFIPSYFCTTFAPFMSVDRCMEWTSEKQLNLCVGGDEPVTFIRERKIPTAIKYIYYFVLHVTSFVYCAVACFFTSSFLEILLATLSAANKALVIYHISCFWWELVMFKQSYNQGCALTAVATMLLAYEGPLYYMWGGSDVTSFIIRWSIQIIYHHVLDRMLTFWCGNKAYTVVSLCSGLWGHFQKDCSKCDMAKVLITDHQYDRLDRAFRGSAALHSNKHTLNCALNRINRASYPEAA